VEPKSSATTAAVNAVTSATAVNPEETVSERTTRLSKDEAVRRYPNLASVGSPEHSKYIHTYNEFKRMYKHEFFADPAWPLNLAELIAVKEGWKRADAAETRPVRSEPAPSAPPSDAAAREAALVRSERLSPGVLVPSPAGEEEVSVVEGAAGGDLSSLSRVFGLELPDADPANPNAPVVAESLQEVRRRYPLMAQAGTEENRLFKESYQEYERLRPDFFSNPRWPGRLADLLAKRMGWKRMDSASGGTERR
jgi:hypothetical protein